jgi:hypothetical protein
MAPKNLINIVDKMTPQEHYELILELLEHPLPRGFSLHKCMRCSKVGWTSEKTHSSSLHFDKNKTGSLILYCNDCISNFIENEQKKKFIENIAEKKPSSIPIRIFSTDGDIEFDSEKDLEQWIEKYRDSEHENFSRSSELISEEICSEREIDINSEIDEELETENENNEESERETDSKENLSKWIDEKREKRRSMERNFIKRMQSEEDITGGSDIEKNIETMRNLLKAKIMKKIAKNSDILKIPKAPIDKLLHITCRIDKIRQYLKNYNRMFIPIHSCDICNSQNGEITCQTHYLISCIEKILGDIRDNKIKSFKDKLKNLDANLNKAILFYENLVRDIEKIFRKI